MSFRVGKRPTKKRILRKLRVRNKILSLRVFDDDQGKMWKRSVKDTDGEILCVSQFTLMANTTKGNKPDFHLAMGAEKSKDMYTSFLEQMKSLYKPDKIKDGRFGAMMSVGLTNEGPVTFTLDSRKFEYIDAPVDKKVLAKARNDVKKEASTASSPSPVPDTA